MKQIKINFSGMGGQFDPGNNFIVDILSRKYKVIIARQPDYLIYSVN